MLRCKNCNKELNIGNARTCPQCNNFYCPDCAGDLFNKCEGCNNDLRYIN